MTPDPFAGPGAKKAGKKANQRKLMIYAGVGLAIVLLVALSRRNAATPASTDTAPEPTPVATPASDGIASDAGTGGTVDNSSQLASFESALLDQLPQTISSSIQAGLANGIPAPFTDSPQVPAGSAGASADLVTGIAAGLSAYPLINIGTGKAGQQTGSAGKKATGTGTKTKKTTHPASTKTKTTAHKPATHKHLPNKPTGRAHKKHG